METKNCAATMASKDTPAIVALRKSLETDRRQLTELIDRITCQEAELAALLSGPSADTCTAGVANANPTKKRKHEETDTTGAAEGDLKMSAAHDDGPITQVMADPMLLGAFILPCLSGVELSRSSGVSNLWKRIATGLESDLLWKALAMKEWPDMIKALVGAGALAQTSFQEFYLRRKRPPAVRPRSLDDDDELFILVDMPNLVKANNDGTECIMPLQPVHRMFPLASCFRKMGSRHQNIYEETACSCASGPFYSRDHSKCSHPSGWLHLPFKKEVFVPNPNTTLETSSEEDVFQLNISLLRKSDGKAIKVLQSSSEKCEVDAPDEFVAPWVMYKQIWGKPPNHDGGEHLRSTAAFVGDNMRESAYYDGAEQDPRNMAFSIDQILFGLEIGDLQFDNTSMVPMKSFDKVDMFLDMMRLEWA